MPLNITTAVTQIKGTALMPTYGLNVYSMLKYNTLVMTTKSIDTLESKLLYYMNHVEYRPEAFEKKVA